MILQFWLGAILLIILVSALFLIPFLKVKQKKMAQNTNRNQLNRALYDVRIAELESDEAQGLLVDKGKMLSELQHNLLDDINDQQAVLINSKNRLLWLPGLLVLIFGSIAIYWSVGAYQEVKNWEDTLQRYPALQSKLFSGSENSPTEQDLRDIMLGLRTHLASDPEDAKGWLLYSRLGMVFKDTELALDAIKKAYHLQPQSIDIRLVYAQLKMQKGDEYSQHQAELMLATLLQENPNELQAWSMYAFMALEKQDYNAAIARWQKMLILVEANSEQAEMLRGSIRYAQQQLQSENAKITQNAKEADKAKLEEIGSPIYNVNINVAKHVVVPESGFIIVYAQALSGSKVPLAAVKLVLTDFPMTTQISDENVMMDGMKLSDQNEFIIKARLSQTGNVMQKEGDWEGVSNTIKAGEITPIDITINKQL